MHQARIADAVLPGAIAALAWYCLARTFYDYSFGLTALRNGVLDATLYYKHWATLILAVMFSGIALGKRGWSSSRLLGHAVVALAILLAHYWFFEGRRNFLASPLRSKIIHGLLPPLVAFFWFSRTERGKLRAGDPLRWTAFPILYTVYGLGRGAMTGVYPSDVSDVGQLGYPIVLGLVGATTLLSVIFGYSLVWLDRELPQRDVPAVRDSLRAAPRPPHCG
jgi:hypothetical protein